MPKGLPHMGDRRTQALVEDSQDKERTSRKFPPFDGSGRYLENIELSASSSKTIYHRLGRAIRGWWIIRPRHDSTIDGWIGESSSDSEKITLANDSTTDITINLWIF